MKYIIQFRIQYFLLFFLLLSCRELKESDVPSGEVIGISDGDTIKILLDGKSVKVRLFGVDSPERAQSFGQKAKEFTSSKAFGKVVKLLIHGEDRYKRLLAEVLLPDGSNLNEELIKNGFAWHYAQYSDNWDWDKLEKQARKKHKGLWQDSNPVAPWEFRKNRREAKQ